jgi:CO/xanthine dehydrogenase Mo-binding subunit
MGQIGQSVPRLDGIAKASGAFRYAGDIRLRDALVAKVLRSPHPHALIKAIDTSEAAIQPGVRTILTYRDVPGPNIFGSTIPDQPVLCYDKVRFVGDALSIVAADSEEEAELALQHIKVDYIPLPIISTPQQALMANAPKIHDKGNLAHRVEYSVGNVKDAFGKADLIVAERYHTSRQKHMYVETEAGFSFPTEGGVEVYAATQQPFQDRVQICRALSLRESDVRVVGMDLGGGFGGKEEITVQIHLALLAMKTKRPVRMIWTREESGIAATTRHPMDIEYKTAFRKDGVLIGNEAHLIADTGAYMSYGPTVIEVGSGQANGPYRIPNTHVEGLCVYTNNPPAGAMRGFGVAQVNFAFETQLDIAAERLRLDPVALRKLNALTQGELDGMGALPITRPRLKETLETIEHTELWKRRKNYRGKGKRPWLSRGIGMAAGMKSTGYGAFPEKVRIKIELVSNGTYIIYLSNPEMGSGATTALTQIGAHVLNTSLSNVKLYAADTKFEIDSGGSDASRAIYVVGNAITKAADELRKDILNHASRKLKMNTKALRLTSAAVVGPGRRVSLRALAQSSSLSVIASYSVLRPPGLLPGTMGLPVTLFSYGACVANVEVNELTGQVRVLNVTFVPEVGQVINPKGLEAQCEGGITQSIGFALMEDMEVAEGKVKAPNFTTYLVPTVEDVTKPNVFPVPHVAEPTGPLGAKGGGELSTIAVPAAICNAIHDAVGARIMTIPATPERVLEAIEMAR